MAFHPRPTAEELQLCVEAMKRHNGVAAHAAKELGLARSTLINRLEMVGWKQTPAAPIADVKAVETKDRLLELQQAKIEALEKERYSLPKASIAKHKGAFRRVIITDTHGCFMDRKAFAAVAEDTKALKPAEIVLLGDHLDCAGWMAKHHPFKTVQEARYSFEEDCDAANAMLDAIQEAAPKAKVYYLEGNHEERIEAWIVEQTQGHPRDAAYLRRHFSPEVVLHLDKRRIQYFRRVDKHCGLRQRGVLRLGKCYFVHGQSHAKNAAAIHVSNIGGNVVFGHVHRPLESPRSDVMNDYRAWCPGCLCEREPMWKHSTPTDWQHGYAIQIVQSNGAFMHINVPIIEEVSLLMPLTKGVA